MHRWIVALLTVTLALTAGAAHAQDLTGQWQGTLTGGPRDLRVVLKVTKGATGTQAVFYSIDQASQGLAGTLTLQGTSVKISVPGLNGTYEGRLSADGNSITGTWSQGGPMPATLNLVRASGDAAWAIPEPPAALRPMPATATPKVETATVKPSAPDAQGRGITLRGRNVVTLNTSVTTLLVFAYGIHPKQVVGAPAWAESEKYDLTIQPDGEGVPNENHARLLLQQMLADRFGLKFHRDKRELPAYALTVAKDGPKLTKSADQNGLPGLFFRGLGVLPATNATMTLFAGVMQGAVLDRPVVDQTGLKDRYDFTLRWTPDESQFASLGARPQPPTGDPNAPPGLFTAIQEQLGLRLDSTRAPVEVLVVDAVNKPTEN